MGAPLPTKSVLLIRAVQSIETSNLMTPELVTPTYCDEEKTPEVEEKKISANSEEKSSRLPTVSEAAKAVAIIGTEKKSFSNFSCMFLNPNIFFPIWI